MPVRDWGLAYAQFAVFFEERFTAWRTRALPLSSRSLSAWKIPIKKKQRMRPLLLPYILQLASGSSSAVPCLAALWILVKMVADNRIYTVYFLEPRITPHNKAFHKYSGGWKAKSLATINNVYVCPTYSNGARSYSLTTLPVCGLTYC